MFSNRHVVFFSHLFNFQIEMKQEQSNSEYKTACKVLQDFLYQLLPGTIRLEDRVQVLRCETTAVALLRY